MDGGLLPFQHLAERKSGRKESHVRLHVGVEALLAIGLFIDIQTIRNKNPGVDVKMIYFDACPSTEAHLELNGKLIVYLGLDLYHGV